MTLLTSKMIYDFLSSGAIFSNANEHLFILWNEREKSLKENLSHLNNETYKIYSPDFFLSTPDSPWINFEKSCEISKKELIQLLEKECTENDSSSKKFDFLTKSEFSPAFEEFKKIFEDLKKQFNTGKLEKAVPYIFENFFTTFSLQNKIYAILSLLKKTQNYPFYLYGMWDENEGILGATPELLIQKKAGESFYETVALAGTQLKNLSTDVTLSKCNLLHDPKEMHEHHLVIQGIKNTFAHYGKIKINETKELEFPLLWHLLTPIQIYLDLEITFINLISKIHPTPALGTYPQKEGKQWLNQYNQKIPRARFGAPFGIMMPDGSFCVVVAIRNIQWNLEEIRIGAGCGIVQESILDKEWKEILGKISSVKNIFL